jgi:hypothetical protein
MSTLRLGIPAGLLCQVEGCEAKANIYPYCARCREEISSLNEWDANAHAAQAYDVEVRPVSQELKPKRVVMTPLDWVLTIFVVALYIYFLWPVAKMFFAFYLGGN